MPRGAGAAIKYLAREMGRGNSPQRDSSNSSSNSNSSSKSRSPQRQYSGNGSGYSSDTDDPRGPRIFPQNVKNECWNRAEEVPGRDPERWRRDAVGNVVFRKLNSCDGCLCHDYDHIVPYSRVR